MRFTRFGSLHRGDSFRLMSQECMSTLEAAEEIFADLANVQAPPTHPGNGNARQLR
jgi:hypothetical protein